MLERMSLGGSFEILIQVCRIDSGIIFACKAAKASKSATAKCSTLHDLLLFIPFYQGTISTTKRYRWLFIELKDCIYVIDLYCIADDISVYISW